ncbi:hypothetical protein JANAI62_29250 [Jannaschia pagri]|uniref:DUF4261 domain-containing protein n=1 Tax=Jannaschia pagri TaxID=2829797 RepID=A0ABQ4NPH1_9RHOB|nr:MULTISPECIES: DUF4261 domain-containing protein [unclassified Jannaschia]GIT92467.1 hypothetical protein JANAI61_29250 [Jannaschia sp. AI_61]GIT96302.1 hypothetical protein JANAI62_29250 [Jannaschia sp. AI_62]
MTQSRRPDAPSAARQPLKAIVLLEDRLHFRVHDIQTALAEDFPLADWSGADVIPDLPFDTGGVAAVPIACGKGIGPGVILGGGPPSLEWSRLFRRAGLAATDDAAERMATSTAHLEITVGTLDAALTKRLRAADVVTAIASVFADLPITTGISLTWCDRMFTPEAFRRPVAAVQAQQIPVLDWVRPAAYRDADAADYTTAVTVGLSAFTGFEIETRQTPLRAAEAMALLMHTADAALRGEELFSDGDVLDGVPSGSERHRVRLVPRGRLGNAETRWTLLHPDSPFNAVKALGRVPASERDAESKPFGLVSRLGLPTGFDAGRLMRRVTRSRS